MNAPMSALLGWLFLSEELSFQALVGISFVLVGVILAIAFGKRKDQLHKLEAIRGPVAIGVLFGTLAALSQSVGSIIIRLLWKVEQILLRFHLCAAPLRHLGCWCCFTCQAVHSGWRTQSIKR